MFFACGILSAPQIARGKWQMRVLKKSEFFFFFFLAEEKNRTNHALDVLRAECPCLPRYSYAEILMSKAMVIEAGPLGGA